MIRGSRRERVGVGTPRSKKTRDRDKSHQNEREAWWEERFLHEREGLEDYLGRVVAVGGEVEDERLAFFFKSLPLLYFDGHLTRM